ncbi:uncharacterized protein [Ptychodera flava]|uniref:uncharacterized protein n=1 Tax=Ptychodera flava TaxID=63121 RepID=UPI00396A9315
MDTASHHRLPFVPYQQDDVDIEVMFATTQLSSFQSPGNATFTVPSSRTELDEILDELGFADEPTFNASQYQCYDGEDDDVIPTLSPPSVDYHPVSRAETPSAIGLTPDISSLPSLLSIAMHIHMCDFDITSENEEMLEATFRRQRYPCHETRRRLARVTGFSLDLVNDWFRRRRAQLLRIRKRLNFPCDPCAATTHQVIGTGRGN